MNKASGAISSLYRQESGRILATLIRILGDFDLAEEMVLHVDCRVVPLRCGHCGCGVRACGGAAQGSEWPRKLAGSGSGRCAVGASGGRDVWAGVL